jgi:UDP:flavonoid glycosyltransferase YjiC (YdhE family)
MVRAAVRRLLDEPSFRARASAVAAEMATYDGPARSAELLEELVAQAASAGSGSGVALTGVSA